VTAPCRLTDSAGIFAREAELEELRRRIRARTSFLIHGDSGVGKTLLLKRVVPEFRRILYCGDSARGETVFRGLANDLLAARDPHLRRACHRLGPQALKQKSILALRGLVLNSLRAGHYWVVLDHLRRTSASLASDVREMIFWGNTPVVAVARSAHMEDLGFLTTWFALRSDRMHVRAFTPAVAEQFAERIANQLRFWASNRDDVLRQVLQFSGGAPGIIVALLRMALLPKYRTEEYVKLTPLYIDYRLSWHAANAL
jgi:hypothetical protein